MIQTVNKQKPQRTLEELAAEANSVPGVGLVCPTCGCRDTRVIRVKHNVKGTETNRRRECRHCGNRVTTMEVIP